MKSAEAMQSLLLWLGEDQTSGANRYEDIRQRLILLFRYRGCHMPEELADETIDRTACAVQKPGFHFEGDQFAYFRGVARNVHHEWLRKEQRLPMDSISEAKIDFPARSGKAGVEDHLLHACLENCLNALRPEKKSLLLRYYQSEKRGKIDDRQQLAEELDVGLNALRIQVFRLRNGLRNCVESCKAKDETVWT